MSLISRLGQVAGNRTFMKYAQGQVAQGGPDMRGTSAHAALGAPRPGGATPTSLPTQRIAPQRQIPSAESLNVPHQPRASQETINRNLASERAGIEHTTGQPSRQSPVVAGYKGYYGELARRATAPGRAINRAVYNAGRASGRAARRVVDNYLPSPQDPGDRHMWNSNGPQR